MAAAGRLGEVWAGESGLAGCPSGNSHGEGGGGAVVSWEVGQVRLHDRRADGDLPVEEPGSSEWLDGWGGYELSCVR